MPNCGHRKMMRALLTNRSCRMKNTLRTRLQKQRKTTKKEAVGTISKLYQFLKRQEATLQNSTARTICYRSRSKEMKRCVKVRCPSRNQRHRWHRRRNLSQRRSLHHNEVPSNLLIIMHGFLRQHNLQKSKELLSSLVSRRMNQEYLNRRKEKRKVKRDKHLLLLK